MQWSNRQYRYIYVPLSYGRFSSLNCQSVPALIKASYMKDIYFQIKWRTQKSIVCGLRSINWIAATSGKNLCRKDLGRPELETLHCRYCNNKNDLQIMLRFCESLKYLNTQISWPVQHRDDPLVGCHRARWTPWPLDKHVVYCKENKLNSDIS